MKAHRKEVSALRMATWNLDWWERNPELRPKLELLQEHERGVIALQEVNAKIAGAIRTVWPQPRAVFSQDVYGPASWRWMGCALLFPAETEIHGAGVIDGLPKPQRSLYVTATLQDQAPMTFVSWHTPNAAGDGRAKKMGAYAAMTDWLIERRSELVVLGADLNTWNDPVDLAIAGQDDWYDENEFVGLSPRHGLVDAYRSVLTPDALERLRAVRPAGPLEISHVLSKSKDQHRMDRIYASPPIQAQRAGYELEKARECGSDHALHWADFAQPADSSDVN
jgi:exonuclease III